jgi:tetratricopeptide (TPR) repeat protein
MRRPILIVGGIFILVFGTITLWKGSRETGDVEEGQSTLSEERKAEIRRFWEVYRRATDLKQQGKWEQAALTYREALAIDPRHEDALYYLGNAMFELERYEEAISAWRRLAGVNPMSARAHAQLGAVYSCGAPGAPFDLDVAEREVQRALAINKEESGPILKMGEVALLKGDRKKALDYFTAAGRTNFKSVEAHYLTGYLKWLEGDRAAALTSLGKAVTLSQADKPIKGVAGEGDTKKKAAQPILSEGASRKSLFGPYWMALREWGGGTVSTARMEEEYRKLDTMLKDSLQNP